MANKILKKITCGALVFASVFACAIAATGCETDRPEVEMQIEFNGETYTLEYEMYRKISPSTVNHFIWLVDNDYYDGLCVHSYDYSAKKMYTGGYKIAEEGTNETGIVYKPYYDEIKKFENYADFPVSVWMDNEKTTPTYTLYGEFSDNGFRVENGKTKQTFGSLTMFYHSKDTKDKVYMPYLSEDKQDTLASRQYKYNSATSLFYIALSEDTASPSEYCTFATLKEKSVDVLKDFQEDLTGFIDNRYGEDGEKAAVSSFVTEEKVTVDEDDVFVGSKAGEQTFYVPNSPIIIKKVSMIKY